MKKLLAVSLTICLSSSAFALNWQMVGARSMAMGGAGVVTASGTNAQYYNPALLGEIPGDEKTWENGFHLGVQGEKPAIIDASRKLMDVSAQFKQLRINIGDDALLSASDLIAISKGMPHIQDLVNDNSFATVSADAGFGLRRGNFGFSIRSINGMVATPVADINNLRIGYAGDIGIQISDNTSLPTQHTTDAIALKNAIASTPSALENLRKMFGITSGYNTAQDLAYAIVNSLEDSPAASHAEITSAVNSLIANLSDLTNILNNMTDASDFYSGNKTRALVDMASFNEASLGYGFHIIHGIRLGGNVKVIEGLMDGTGIMLLSDDVGFSTLMKDAWKNRKFSTNWGLDLGAAINFSDLFQSNVLFNPDLGITAKNLNSPKFKRPKRPAGWAYEWNSEDYKLKPQYRAGASIHPFTNRVTVAADIDLNKNDTISGNYKSRQLSLGLEVIAMQRHTFQLPVRVGMNKNLAEHDAPTYITAGFGALNHDFDFELGLAIGDRTEKVNGNDWPNAMGLSMTFAWFF